MEVEFGAFRIGCNVLQCCRYKYNVWTDMRKMLTQGITICTLYKVAVPENASGVSWTCKSLAASQMTCRKRELIAQCWLCMCFFQWSKRLKPCEALPLIHFHIVDSNPILVDTMIANLWSNGSFFGKSDH